MKSDLALQTVSGTVASLAFAGIVICIGAICYLMWVRPQLVAAGKLAAEPTWYLWIKNRWDLFAAGGLAGLIGIWNNLLDVAVILFHTLSEAAPALQSIDLTGVELPKWLQFIMQALAILLPIYRAVKAQREREKDA